VFEFAPLALRGRKRDFNTGCIIIISIKNPFQQRSPSLTFQSEAHLFYMVAR
jgi:hypothetical protein